MEKDEQILVCEDCENPLIGTICFSSAEKYCPTCGATESIFFGKRVPLTKELEERRKVVKDFWKTVVGKLLTGGAMKTNCEMCRDERRPHLSHCSDKELEEHQWALKELNRFKEV